MMLDAAYIKDLLDYISSGRLFEDFEYSPEERRYEMLDFLEQLMELGEAADEVATKIIFRKSGLGDLTGSDEPQESED